MIRPSLLRPLARQVAPVARPLAARRWASAVSVSPDQIRDHQAQTTPEHHSPAEPHVKPPPGVEVDPQLHGYPQLPEVSLQDREPFGWWDIQERKNFNETVQEQEDILGMWGPDVHKISAAKALGAIVLAALGIAGFTYTLAVTAPAMPATRRSYPYDGLAKELAYGRARVEPVDLAEAEE